MTSSFALGAVFAGLGLFGMLKWRQAVHLALILAVFEGAIRKWIMPDVQQYVYFFKDALLLGAYAAFVWWRARTGRRLFSPHPANLALALLFVLAVLEIANPELPSPMVGVFGLKAYLMYVPLMYMVPAVFTDAAALRRFWIRYLALALIPFGLGSTQFYAPPDSVLNRYPWGEEGTAGGVALFGLSNMARITGTFSFITGYTSYLVLVIVFGLALAMGERARWLQWSLYGFVGVAVTNLVMTGSRGPFVVLGAAVPILVGLSARAGRGSWRRVVLTLGMSLPVIGLLVTGVVPEAGTAFVERATETGDIFERAVDAIGGPIWAMSRAGLTGYGIGSTHQAISFLAPSSTMAPLEAEGEWVRIVLEMGPVGFGLVLLVRILVVRRLWAALTSPEAGAARPFLTGAFVYCLLCLPGDVIFTHTTSVFYWFVAGFALVPGAKGRVAIPVGGERGERDGDGGVSGRTRRRRRPELA